MKAFILSSLAEVQNGYSLCGVVDRKARVYPLGSDTKVISAWFEIVARQSVAAYAEVMGMELIEPTQQNHYPDFTLSKSKEDKQKIAIDVKTTYRRVGQTKFGHTLGSYACYFRLKKEVRISRLLARLQTLKTRAAVLLFQYPRISRRTLQERKSMKPYETSEVADSK